MSSMTTKFATLAVIGAAAAGGATLANAATSTTTSPSATPPKTAPQGAPHDPSKGGHTANGRTEALLSGSTAAKVKAAALAKVPGTVERVETNVDSSAPYEAHIQKADGSEVEVQVGRDFTVSAVNAMGHR